MLRSFKRCAIALERGRALQVYATTVAENARVEPLVIELNVKAQLIAVIRKRTSQVGDAENWRDVLEVARQLGHGPSLETSSANSANFLVHNLVDTCGVHDVNRE